MSLKIVSLVGARPQFIKEAVLCEQLAKAGINEVIVNSGQHYDNNMSDVFFSSLNIKQPKYNLSIGSGKHGEMTAKIMIEFEKVLEIEKPDLVLVYGDTNTTLAGAIVASKMKIKIGHVEAGIRMLPKDMPEEINRVLVDRISNLLFCPSKHSVNNLKKEGIVDGVHNVGDVMYDLYKGMEDSFLYDGFASLNLKENKYTLLTLHRDYNVDDKTKLEKILEQLGVIASDINIVFPVHPRTKKRIEEFGLKGATAKITMVEPMDYLNLMGLLKRSSFVITDSGGLQKEAYFARKHAVVVMPDTGWAELVENKCISLCNENNLVDVVNSIKKHQCVEHLYGDGNSAEKIAKIVKDSI